MNKFNVGDRVKYSPTAYQDDVLEAGDLGTVVYYDEFNSVGVRWDKKDEVYFHDCDQYCEDKHGFYVGENQIEKVSEESVNKSEIKQLKNEIARIVSDLNVAYSSGDNYRVFAAIKKLRKISSEG